MANEYLNNRNFESIILAFQFFKRQKAKYELIIADLKETHERRVAKYGDDERKAALEENEKLYKEACENYQKYQKQLTYAFYILSENIANYAKFTGIDIDDAIQEGVVICLEKVDRFNPAYIGKNGQKAKAFNYMTTCILNHYRQLYRSARNYNELKRRYFMFVQEKLDSVIRNGKEHSLGKSGIDRDQHMW